MFNFLLDVLVVLSGGAFAGLSLFSAGVCFYSVYQNYMGYPVDNFGILCLAICSLSFALTADWIIQKSKRKF